MYLRRRLIRDREPAPQRCRRLAAAHLLVPARELGDPVLSNRVHRVHDVPDRDAPFAQVLYRTQAIGVATRPAVGLPDDHRLHRLRPGCTRHCEPLAAGHGVSVPLEVLPDDYRLGLLRIILLDDIAVLRRRYRLHVAKRDLFSRQSPFVDLLQQ